MTNEELEELTAPDWYRPPLPMPGKSLTVAQVEAARRRHRCGRCNNPFTGGRDDCPNNDIDGVDRDMDAYREYAENRIEAEMDRQRGFDV